MRNCFVTRDHAATFRAAPGHRALRPGPPTALPGLVLAGAWTDTGWPATMEGAVRSGHAAAERIIRRLTDRGPGRSVSAAPTSTWVGASAAHSDLGRPSAASPGPGRASAAAPGPGGSSAAAADPHPARVDGADPDGAGGGSRAPRRPVGRRPPDRDGRQARRPVRAHPRPLRRRRGRDRRLLRCARPVARSPATSCSPPSCAGPTSTVTVRRPDDPRRRAATRRAARARRAGRLGAQPGHRPAPAKAGAERRRGRRPRIGLAGAERRRAAAARPAGRARHAQPGAAQPRHERDRHGRRIPLAAPGRVAARRVGVDARRP